MPICIVDTEGTLIFYNEHAEAVLNQRFDETGDMQASEWTALFAVDDMARNAVPIDDWPLVRETTADDNAPMYEVLEIYLGRVEVKP